MRGITIKGRKRIQKIWWQRNMMVWSDSYILPSCSYHHHHNHVREGWRKGKNSSRKKFFMCIHSSHTFVFPRKWLLVFAGCKIFNFCLLISSLYANSWGEFIFQCSSINLFKQFFIKSEFIVISLTANFHFNFFQLLHHFH